MLKTRPVGVWMRWSDGSITYDEVLYRPRTDRADLCASKLGPLWDTVSVSRCGHRLVQIMRIDRFISRLGLSVRLYLSPTGIVGQTDGCLPTTSDRETDKNV